MANLVNLGLGIGGGATGLAEAINPEADAGERVGGGLEFVHGTIDSMGEMAGLGSSLLEGSEAGEALGTVSELCEPAGLVAGAGLLGYKAGQFLDEKFHLSDHASDLMVGSMDDRVKGQIGAVRQNQRGAAGIQAANDAYMMDVGKQVQEDAEKALARAQLAQMWAH
jgi:hypothetical protein